MELRWTLCGPSKSALSPNVPWGKPQEILWLNPPFGNIEAWAMRPAEYAPLLRQEGGWLLMLTPASIGTAWFANYVHRKALVIGIRPRLTFEGTTDPYPKDLMLSVFGAEPDFDVWRVSLYDFYRGPVAPDVTYRAWAGKRDTLEYREALFLPGERYTIAEATRRLGRMPNGVDRV